MLLIFDWDGTISDSAAKIVACMQDAAEQCGQRICSAEEIKNIIGLGLPEAMRALYSGISDKDSEQMQKAYASHFVAADVQPSPFFSGAMETMQALRDAGHYLAVATGKSRHGLDRVLERLDLQDFFHSTRCADETASKPQPLMLQELLEEFSCDLGDAVMIGDTEYDMAMAKAIGMDKIAVSYGAHHIDRLKPYDPVLCVDEFAQMLGWSKLE